MTYDHNKYYKLFYLFIIRTTSNGFLLFADIIIFPLTSRWTIREMRSHAAYFSTATRMFTCILQAIELNT